MGRFGSHKTASATKGGQDAIRKLGHSERFQSAQHLVEAYYGCALSCRYAVPPVLRTPQPTSESLKDFVENAFALAILEHPLFTVGRAQDDSRKPSWIRLDRIDLNNHLEWQTVTETQDYDKVLQGVLEDQVGHKFTHLEARPHWRSVILGLSNLEFIDIVFAWDHTAADGKSGKVFHESLLACLNTRLGAKEPGPVKDRTFEVPVTALTPAMQHLIKLTVSFDFVLSEVKQILNVSRSSKSPYTMTGWAPVQLRPYTTRISLIKIDKDALAPILEACRKHGTTLTGLGHALILVSMASRLSQDKARAFVCGTPICMRRYYQKGPPGDSSFDLEKTAGNFVTPWEYNFDADTVAKVRQQVSHAKSRSEPSSDLEAIMWSQAIALRQELGKKIKKGTKDDVLGLIKFVPDCRSFIKDQLKTRTTAWEISNLGVIDGAPSNGNERSNARENWTIERSIFTQSASVCGPALTFSPIAVKNKDLFMTCCWQPEVVDDNLARGVSLDLESWLDVLGKTGRIPFEVSTEDRK
ncbi:hypothetical protein NM208_g2612 [Fusarium decemcellulare]|uniref:Uncharacterized protein n=1 Tax=Fusarium decemcellulare TaxID=57161 RepID=A0ACC1SS61_9HYPO|nr:hypothetical protein NM208_g2612 [Fusarium decemcellulare]